MRSVGGCVWKKKKEDEVSDDGHHKGWWVGCGGAVRGGGAGKREAKPKQPQHTALDKENETEKNPKNTYQVGRDVGHGVVCHCLHGIVGGGRGAEAMAHRRAERGRLQHVVGQRAEKVPDGVAQLEHHHRPRFQAAAAISLVAFSILLPLTGPRAATRPEDVPGGQAAQKVPHDTVAGTHAEPHHHLGVHAAARPVPDPGAEERLVGVAPAGAQLGLDPREHRVIGPRVAGALVVRRGHRLDARRLRPVPVGPLGGEALGQIVVLRQVAPEQHADVEPDVKGVAGREAQGLRQAAGDEGVAEGERGEVPGPTEPAARVVLGVHAHELGTGVEPGLAEVARGRVDGARARDVEPRRDVGDVVVRGLGVRGGRERGGRVGAPLAAAEHDAAAGGRLDVGADGAEVEAGRGADDEGVRVEHDEVDLALGGLGLPEEDGGGGPQEGLHGGGGDDGEEAGAEAEAVGAAVPRRLALGLAGEVRGGLAGPPRHLCHTLPPETQSSQSGAGEVRPLQLPCRECRVTRCPDAHAKYMGGHGRQKMGEKAGFLCTNLYELRTNRPNRP